MKKGIKITAFILFCFFSLSTTTSASHCDTTHHKSSSNNVVATQAQIAKPSPNIKVVVKGMVCSFCAQGITNSLKNHIAVKDIEIDMENSVVNLYKKKMFYISDKKIHQIIEDAGYEVSEIIKP